MMHFFWFDKPQLLLWLSHFISFQNSFEVASSIWSWWEIKAHTCFMKSHAFVYTCLISGRFQQPSLAIESECNYQKHEVSSFKHLINHIQNAVSRPMWKLSQPIWQLDRAGYNYSFELTLSSILNP